MKLKNKKTGEIIEVESCNNASGCISIYYEEKDGQIGTKDCYTSLAELNAEWEDYKEPKDIWWLDNEGNVNHASGEVNDNFKKNREIGNYFLSREEAELAVRKLKAWKRLKDKGFKTEGWTIDDGLRVSICTNLNSDGIYDEDMKETKKDLDICFGGEE